jgi:CheY-like chemotaxis protein
MPKDVKGKIRRLNILLADDNRDYSDTLGLLLQSQGHEVHITYDGAAALIKAEALRPDLVLLDIGMPLMSGLDIARGIRAQPWGQNICLIAITAWGTEQDKQRSMAAGFNRHLTKPVDLDSLMSILNNIDTLK